MYAAAARAVEGGVVTQFLCELKLSDGSLIKFEQAVRFSLRRRRYSPLAVFTAEFALPGPLSAEPGDVKVTFDGQIVHEGFAVRAHEILQNGTWILSLVSWNYAAALQKIQPPPGVLGDVTLDALMQNAPKTVTWEPAGGGGQYIFIPEHSNLWDALCVFNYQLNGGQPYLRASNTVCVLPRAGDSAIEPPQRTLVLTRETDFRNVISRVEMADIDGTPGAFTAVNPDAGGIESVAQMAFDERFARNPALAPRYRIDRSARAFRVRTAEYQGFLGEDIGDLVNIPGVGPARVSEITVSADQNGVRTADRFFSDLFSPDVDSPKD